MGVSTLVVVPKVDARGKLGEVVRLRIYADLLRRIDDVCQETGQNRSNAIRFLLEAGLELHEKDKRGKK